MQIIEGVIEPLSRSWGDELVAESIRRQIGSVVERLGCMAGSGNLDLPGGPNWYVPDLVVVPDDLAKDATALTPDQTLLVVEVTSESNGHTDRVVKRRRLAEYGAPLYLLVDRQGKTLTLFAKPGPLGYTSVSGPHPFGPPLHLPEPFDLELDTGDSAWKRSGPSPRAVRGGAGVTAPPRTARADSVAVQDVPGLAEQAVAVPEFTDGVGDGVRPRLQPRLEDRLERAAGGGRAGGGGGRVSRGGRRARAEESERGRQGHRGGAGQSGHGVGPFAVDYHRRHVVHHCSSTFIDVHRRSSLLVAVGHC